MDNIIRFPNNELKRLKESNSKPELSDGQSSGEKIELKDLYACIPVKFSEKTRHEEYYLITFRENRSFVYETTEYIKVDMQNPIDKTKWIYPEKGKGMSGFEFENSKHLSKKYLFLHRAYANHLVNLFLNDTENFRAKYLKLLGELPITLQINGRNNYKFSLNIDRANEYGLMLSRGYTDELELVYIGKSQTKFPYIHGLTAVVYDDVKQRIMFLEPVTLREGFDERNDENLLDIDNVLFVENKAFSELFMNDFLANRKSKEATNGQE